MQVQVPVKLALVRMHSFHDLFIVHSRILRHLLVPNYGATEWHLLLVSTKCKAQLPSSQQIFMQTYKLFSLINIFYQLEIYLVVGPQVQTT
jgi:hypothetical protein